MSDLRRKKRGRPTQYNEQIAAEIIKRLMLGETLPRICADGHMPSRTTVMRWASEDRAGFSDRYMRAREMQRDAWVDDIVDIADDSTRDHRKREIADGNSAIIFDKDNVERSKLRIASRQWLMAVGGPQKYGQKVEMKHGASDVFLRLWQVVGSGER